MMLNQFKTIRSLQQLPFYRYNILMLYFSLNDQGYI